jgi:hypothetical protein
VVLRQKSSITVLNDSIIAAERRDVYSSTLISDLLGKGRMLRISLFAGESKGCGGGFYKLRAYGTFPIALPAKSFEANLPLW